MTNFNDYSMVELKELKENLEKVTNKTAVKDLLIEVKTEIDNRIKKSLSGTMQKEYTHDGCQCHAAKPEEVLGASRDKKETALCDAGAAVLVNHAFKQDFGDGNVSYYYVFGQLRGLLKVEVVRFANGGNTVEMYNTSVKEEEFLKPKVKEGQKTAPVVSASVKEYDDARKKAESILEERNKKLDSLLNEMEELLPAHLYFPALRRGALSASPFWNPFWYPFALGF